MEKITAKNSNFFSVLFENVNLTAANFEASELNQIQFNRCNLHRGLFIEAKIQGTDFSIATETKHINLFKATIKQTTFKGMDLTAVCLQETQLEGVDFSQCRLSPSNFNQSRIINCRFDSADLRQSLFEESEIRDSSFIQAELSYARFNNSSLTTCNFTKANLNLASLHHITEVRVNWEHVALDNVLQTNQELLEAEQWS